MEATAPIDQVLRAISRADRLLVTSHARPDGDAVGGMLACWMILRRMGKQADMALSDRVPAIYRSLPCASQVGHWSRVEQKYDAVILLECDSLARTGMEGLENQSLINLDHHVSGCAFADVNWIDSDACAVAELVYRLAEAAGVGITPAMATCLYAAVLTDTGCFCYPRTDARTLGLACDLVRHGADPVKIARQVYFSNSAAKMFLLGAALANLHQERQLAWLWISLSDMARSDAREEDCEGIVNYAISIAEVEVAVFFRELPDGRTRLSMRSKGRVNVAKAAERFGGGGHEAASGCTLPGPLSPAMDLILNYLREELAKTAAPPGTA